MRVVRRMYELYNALPDDPHERRDSPLLEEMLALYGEEIEFVQDAAMPGAATFHGRAAAERSWADWLSAWRSQHSEIEAVEERGDSVLVLTRDRFETHDGVPIGNRGAAIFTLRDGEITRITIHVSHDAARAAFEEG